MIWPAGSNIPCNFYRACNGFNIRRMEEDLYFSSLSWLFSKWIYYSDSLQVILDWGVASLHGNEINQTSRNNAPGWFAPRTTEQTLALLSHSSTKGLPVCSLAGLEASPWWSCCCLHFWGAWIPLLASPAHRAVRESSDLASNQHVGWGSGAAT